MLHQISLLQEINPFLIGDEASQNPTGQLRCITLSCVDTDISGMRPEETLPQVPTPVLGLSVLGFPLVSSSPVLSPLSLRWEAILPRCTPRLNYLQR